MKTNKIVHEWQFNIAKLSENKDCSYQNNSKNWIVFGTYGCTIRIVKDSKVLEKHLNDWRQFNYNDFCTEMDKIEIELPF